MPALEQVFIFAFGTIIGSFLNAVLWRLWNNESFLAGRSHCVHCRHELAATDLVPIFSYLLLGGRCRYCRRAISPSYLTIEVTTGVLFLLAALRWLPPSGEISGQVLPRLLLAWYCLAILTVVFVFDLRHMLILPSVVLPAAAVVFAANLFLGVSWLSLLLGCLIAAGFFYLQLVVSGGRWIGGGDVYLGVLLGAMLGWQRVLVALFLAYVAGAVVGVGLMLFKKKNLQSQLPFGTFLAAAAAVSLLWGERLILWYLHAAV